MSCAYTAPPPNLQMAHPCLHQAVTRLRSRNPEEGPGESRPTSFLPWVAADTALCIALPLAPGTKARVQGGLALCAKHRKARKNVKSNKGSAAAAAGKQASDDRRSSRGARHRALLPRPARLARRPGASVLIWSNDSAGVLEGGSGAGCTPPAEPPPPPPPRHSPLGALDPGPAAGEYSSCRPGHSLAWYTRIVTRQLP